MMNKQQKLTRVVLSGAALLILVSAWSVQAADATLTFTGTITPAANSVKASADNKASNCNKNEKCAAQANIKEG